MTIVRQIDERVFLQGSTGDKIVPGPGILKKILAGAGFNRDFVISH